MSENKFIVRRATEQDIPSLALLMNELGYPTTNAEMQQRYELLAAHPDYTTWVATCHNEVAGMIGLLKSMFYEKNGFYIRIAALAVSTGYRKKGIGKLLVNKAEEWASELGAPVLILNSGNRIERKEAHAFYQHMGFEPKSTGFVKVIK